MLDNTDLRNNEDVPDFAAQAIGNRQFDPDGDVYGVKALFRLYFMLPIMISCMAVDPVHVGEPFSLNQVLNVVDKRLTSTRPPDFVQRFPRGIDIAQWKCLDLKLFLLY